MISAVIDRLKSEEQAALEHAYQLALELTKARRAHRARQEERQAYEATGVLPRRMRRLALRVLLAKVAA